MNERAFPPPPEPVGVIRLECRVCGVHVIVLRTLSPSGQCTNCGSYDVRPVPRDDADDPSGLGRAA